ncbi:MAG TPA: ABC transporter ATP-binding protein [Gemmatimonadales bacterium]|jgi:ABC-2 type transport system ATP-binding protein
MNPTIEIQRASKAFGPAWRRRRALHAVSLTVHGGEIVGVVGPNGAGKTTLLQLIAGDLRPDSGSVHVDRRWAGTREARAVLGYAADPPVLAPQLSGLRWLRYFAAHRASSRAEQQRLVRWAIECTGLESQLLRRTGVLSRGAAQRLALAAAALAGSRALVLDELLSGVDPLAHRVLRAQLCALARAGRALVVASHDLASLERVVTRVIVLDRGKVRADVAISEVLAERIAEVVFTPSAGAGLERVRARFPMAVPMDDGLAVPLRRGVTLEAVLSACRAERLSVAASRVRHGALEDLFVKVVDGGPDGD